MLRQDTARIGPRSELEHAARVGSAVPDFNVESLIDGSFRELGREDLAGSWWLLLLYPRDFDVEVGAVLAAFDERARDFEALGATVLAASRDTVYTHQAWLRTSPELQDLKLPLVEGLHTGLASALGLFDPEREEPLRASVYVDPRGVLRHVDRHDDGEDRAADDALRRLRLLQGSGAGRGSLDSAA